jgi:hypothetical protein
MQSAKRERESTSMTFLELCLGQRLFFFFFLTFDLRMKYLFNPVQFFVPSGSDGLAIVQLIFHSLCAFIYMP